MLPLVTQGYVLVTVSVRVVGEVGEESVEVVGSVEAMTELGEAEPEALPEVVPEIALEAELEEVPEERVLKEAVPEGVLETALKAGREETKDAPEEVEKSEDENPTEEGAEVEETWLLTERVAEDMERV